MSSNATTPNGRISSLNDEGSVLHFPDPACPDCNSQDVSKNGSYDRNPAGCEPTEVQRYVCEDHGSFSPSHPFVEDDHHYPQEVIDLSVAIDLFTVSSLESIQDIHTVAHRIRPSDQQIKNWLTEETEEIVDNDLPEYSSIYIYDEQFLRINGRRAYRLTVYDELMRAPVAEAIVPRCTKDTVREFLTTALADKPTNVITTDGRSDYAEIIEDDLDAFHHRCQFHFIRNGEKKLRKKFFKSPRYSSQEKLQGAIVWSEFKQVFAARSYAEAIRRFEAVLDKIDHLPPNLRAAVEEVMERFDKFALHLRDEWVPSTTNNLERYYGNTKAAKMKGGFRSIPHARAFMKRQMQLRTIKQGLISRERSLAIARELFPSIEMDQVTPLFIDFKRRYLSWRDLDPG